MNWTGPANAITWKNLSLVSRDPCSAIPGWPGCHVIEKLIIMALNKRAEIPANRH